MTNKRTVLGLMISCILFGCSMRASGQTKDAKLNADQERGQVLTVLQQGATEEIDPEELKAAIDKAGKLKSVEAIPSLVKLITFRYKSKEEKEMEKEMRENGIYTGKAFNFGPAEIYPAIDALAQIGEPALPDLMELFKENKTDSLLSENAYVAFLLIFRKDPQAGVDRLRAEATSTDDPDQKQRLLQVANKFENLTKGQREGLKHAELSNQ